MTSVKNLKKECFDSIEEMPIWNWWKVQETGDLIYLRKDGDLNGESGTVEMWTKLHDEYLETYGMTTDFQQMLRLKKDWILKQAKYVVEGDRFAITQAEIVDAKIKEILNSGSTMTKEETIIFLEERLGREIDPKTLSVKKYNDYIKYYSKK